jgi:hypothetical protein
MKRRMVIFPILALLLGAALAPPALASNSWSDTDPRLVIVTPAGHRLPVHLTIGVLGVEHLPAARAAVVGYTVQPSASGTATAVALTVTVPNDSLSPHFQTRTIVSSERFGAGVVYGQAYGSSGHPMQVSFTLPVR